MSMTPTCITGSLRCPRAYSCWRWVKPAEPGQSYQEHPGGDDCPDFVAVDEVKE